MLGRHRDHMVLLLAIDPRQPLDGEIVRFGGARSEDDLLGVGADQLGDLLARQLHRLFRRPAEAVRHRMGVAEALGEVRQHLFHDARIAGGGGLIVEIDRKLHAASCSRISRCEIEMNWSRKPSISVSVVAHPRLRRIAEPASTLSPIARSTGLGPNLPELQADPALTAIPARSSAISSVCAGTLGKARQDVLDSRPTLRPKMLMPGSVSSARLSMRSRKPARRAASAAISPRSATAAAKPAM